MQIHELNNFTGTLGSGAYLAIDDGNDTGKISSQGLLAATEARIDNIIAGPAPSAEEIVDARLGDDGVTYPSLGDAIRDQVGDLKSEINDIEESLSLVFVDNQAVAPDTVVFDKDDVLYGETIVYVLDSDTSYKSFYLDVLDTSGQRIAYYGVGSSSTTQRHAEGTFTIPANFGSCVVKHNGTATITATVKGLFPYFDEIQEIKSDITALPSEIKGSSIVANQTYHVDDEIFDSLDVWVGETLQYDLTLSSPYRQGYFKLIDANGNELAKYGITVSSTAETHASGAFTIPDRFDKAVAFINNAETTFVLSITSNYEIKDEFRTLNMAISNKPTLYHVLVTGQSLAVGAEGQPAITKYCPLEFEGTALMFNGGARLPNIYNNESLHTSWPDYTPDEYMATFASLHEADSNLNQYTDSGVLTNCGWGETINSGIGYWFARSIGEKILVSNHSYGGKSYANLKKGSVCYENVIRAVKTAKSICERYGWNYKVLGVCVVHGEADTTTDVTTEEYQAYLEEWQTDYDTDIKAITGQTDTVKFYLSQTDYAGCEGKDAYVANADYLQAVYYPSRFKLVTPQYIWPIVYVSSHMNAMGYRILGEYFGQAVWRDFNGLPMRAIYPIKSEVSGNTITLTFNTMGNVNLTFRDNLIAVTDGNHGFDLEDSGGATITDITISNSPTKQVIITCSQAPSNDATISYAYKAKAEYTNHLPGYQTGCRGNLSDSDWFHTIYTDNNMTYPDWGCVFSIPVNFDPS